ncbi:hypothetical protein cyc_05014 [Cyclospora cayetanensis]|uniref:Uncharacterized protein n=1 Tax=Cyclospora cayetanensis TaxID=88456 RepID=A0A1D3CVT8_9EIME|nr:hypothetical protein cyc_05014 [Cyclospora cayetanensis]
MDFCNPDWFREAPCRMGSMTGSVRGPLASLQFKKGWTDTFLPAYSRCIEGPWPLPLTFLRSGGQKGPRGGSRLGIVPARLWKGPSEAPRPHTAEMKASLTPEECRSPLGDTHEEGPSENSVEAFFSELAHFLRLTDEGLIEMEHADDRGLEGSPIPSLSPDDGSPEGGPLGSKSPRSRRRGDAAHTMNFSQAALLIERSTAVWGTRIESLHAMAFNLLHHAQQQQQQQACRRLTEDLGGPPLTLQQLRQKTLRQLGSAPCLLMPEAPPALRQEGPPPGPQGTKAPDIIRLPAILRGPSAPPFPEKAKNQSAEDGGSEKRLCSAVAMPQAPDEGPRMAYNELRGLQVRLGRPSLGGPLIGPLRVSGLALYVDFDASNPAVTPSRILSVFSSCAGRFRHLTQVTILRVHRETGALLATASDAAAYNALAREADRHQERPKEGLVTVSPAEGLPYAEAGSAGTWEESADVFEECEARATPPPHPEEGPKGAPSSAKDSRNGFSPVTATSSGALQTDQGEGFGRSPRQQLNEPDCWVRELLREGQGAPPHEKSCGAPGGPLVSLGIPEIRAVLGLPEDSGPQEAPAEGLIKTRPLELPPHRISFLNSLYGDLLGVPPHHVAANALDRLAFSAHLHLEFLFLKQKRRRLQEKGASSGGGPTAATLLEMILAEGPTQREKEAPGASQIPPQEVFRGCALFDALMSLPSTCEDPRETQGPQGGVVCRAPPPSILEAPEENSLLQVPGGPLMFHRASTREGQEALLRGLWGAIPTREIPHSGAAQAEAAAAEESLAVLGSCERGEDEAMADNFVRLHEKSPCAMAACAAAALLAGKRRGRVGMRGAAVECDGGCGNTRGNLQGTTAPNGGRPLSIPLCSSRLALMAPLPSLLPTGLGMARWVVVAAAAACKVVPPSRASSSELGLRALRGGDTAVCQRKALARKAIERGLLRPRAAPLAARHPAAAAATVETFTQLIRKPRSSHSAVAEAAALRMKPLLALNACMPFSPADELNAAAAAARRSSKGEGGGLPTAAADEELAIQMRVARWNAYVEDRLLTLQSLPSFDIRAYETSLLREALLLQQKQQQSQEREGPRALPDVVRHPQESSPSASLESPNPSSDSGSGARTSSPTATFASLVQGKPRYEVCRAFLTTLLGLENAFSPQLTNARKVSILQETEEDSQETEEASGPTEAADFKIQVHLTPGQIQSVLSSQ